MSFMVVMDDFEDNNEEYEAWHLKILLLLYMFKSFHIGLSKPDNNEYIWNMVRMWWIGNNMRIVISFIAGSNERCR